jgi:DNA-directed RNA polymerase specialized sigma24 family protein
VGLGWDRIEPWDYIVNNVSAEYHKHYPMCDLDDIKQHLYEWFLTHPKKLDEWEAIGKRDAKNLIYRSLRNHALDYCQYWKARALGYEVEDLFFYTPEMVETLLPAVLLDSREVLPQLNLGNTGKSGLVSESGNALVMLAEIAKVCVGLSDEDKQALHLRFALGYEYPEIVKTLELNTEDAARQRVRRAVKRIINKLGGYKPYDDSEDSPSEETATETPEEETITELV